MIKFKKMVILGATVFTIGAISITAFASSTYKSPAEVVSGVTGKTIENVTNEKKESNKTYGTIAKEAGKLEEFKKASLQMKKDKLNARVQAGEITQEKADEIIKKIEENQANCDGSGSGKIGQKLGAKFGFGNKNKGNGQGKGKSNGNGKSMNGNGLRDSSCNAISNK